MKRLPAVLLMFCATTAFAATEAIELKTATGSLHGTLIIPEAKKPPVALIIAGSGPTDRDGNNPLLGGPNDSLKMVAEGLAAKGIASLRYDKRGIGASKAAGPAESALRFETLVEDAQALIELLKKDPRLGKVFVIGHSEGSLIGMLAAKKGAAQGFVSVAGTSQRAADIIRAQLAGKLPEDLAAASERALQSLSAGKTVDDPPAALAALYRPSVQPYLISWFRYDPKEEIAKLDVPVLVTHGATDLQVPAEEARVLAKRKGGEPVIVEGMNHVLKLASGDLAAQMPSYRRNDLPVAPQLVKTIAEFILRK